MSSCTTTTIEKFTSCPFGYVAETGYTISYLG
jgi:hypothetical protein